MTELQEVEFRLLQEFVRICDRLQLRYYMVCGSALGAVKYGGFIPWDDDVDVALPRADYERFLQQATAELPDGVFLQNYRTDPNYPQLGSKLRDSHTTFVEKSVRAIPMNHGVYIDVFPLDYYPADPDKVRRYEKAKWHCYRRRCSELRPWYHKNFGLTVACLLDRLGIPTDTQAACARMEQMIVDGADERSGLLCNFANSMLTVEYARQEQYGDGAWSGFETLQVRIPEQYDAYLTQKYGAWREKLPEREQYAHHHCAILDLERPYTDYLQAGKKHEKKTFKMRAGSTLTAPVTA